MMLEPPKITSVGDTYLLEWQHEGIQAKINRIIEKADIFSAEIIITKGAGHLYQARANLLSPSAKRTLANEMSARANGVDWNVLIEQAFVKTINLYRQGEPIVNVGSLPKRQATRYRLFPLILEREMCALYAYGGSGKSILSDFMAVLVQCGVSACGLKPVKGNVLILDWETSKETVDERVKAIKKGLGITSIEEPFYKRCYHVLANDIYEIQEEVGKNDIQLIVVDSVNMAGGVTSEYHAPAIAMLSALRSIGRSILLIDHKPKMGDSMFGSIVKYNACRSAWSIEINQEDNSDIMDMGVFHTKHNDTKKFKPLGFTIQFIGDDETLNEVVFSQQSVESMPKVSELVSVASRILDCLRHGAYTPEELSSELDKTPNHIRKELTTLKKKDKVINLDYGKWGLLDNTVS